MTTRCTMNTSIEVAVDPDTAFSVFTAELDCWWLQGPINFYDSARAYDKRMEPGVGGRIVEVYDDATGDGLELARITVWEPGVRVAWKSSLDDVAIEVRFDKSNNGTLVRVEATLPDGGADKGGTAWLRMTPLWFGSWIRKRDRVPHEPLRLARLAVAVHYAKPATAARWLQDVFGFEPSGNIPDDDAAGDHTWIEFQVGNAPLILFQRDGDPPTDGPVTHAPWVFVDDLDAHHARAKQRGATVEDIVQHGFRGYTATDLEGNRWTFAQASPRQL